MAVTSTEFYGCNPPAWGKLITKFHNYYVRGMKGKEQYTTPPSICSFVEVAHCIQPRLASLSIVRVSLRI